MPRVPDLTDRDGRDTPGHDKPGCPIPQTPVPPLAIRAPAKVNLTLHVLGRRPDGYHALESLVAFAGAGDTLTLAPGGALDLAVEGPTGVQAGPVEGNLIVKAARGLAERVEGLRWGAFHLVKRLPVAAGIGGGSSDAAAALRLLARLNDLSLDHPAVREAARATGADVPVCLAPCARMMAGAGERIGPALRLPHLFAVLVNPGVPVETPAVFQRLGLAPGEAFAGDAHPAVEAGLSRDRLMDRICQARNDLEPPALALAPVIGEALDRLREVNGCRLARMSGSGATVFGLFDDCGASAATAKTIRRAQPGWWVRATVLR
jgi:4-diphosphocytidyl-2-C-methyl-D-erythritol kinase